METPETQTNEPQHVETPTQTAEDVAKLARNNKALMNEKVKAMAERDRYRETLMRHGLLGEDGAVKPPPAPVSAEVGVTGETGEVQELRATVAKMQATLKAKDKRERKEMADRAARQAMDSANVPSVSNKAFRDSLTKMVRGMAVPTENGVQWRHNGEPIVSEDGTVLDGKGIVEALYRGDGSYGFNQETSAFFDQAQSQASTPRGPGRPAVNAISEKERRAAVLARIHR